jgi:peptidoglycan/LPS O-acetylase OafA/YrhL
MVIFCHLDYHGAWRFSFTRLGHVFTVSSDFGFIGYVGVNLFLVLSGFCLYWPLVRPGRKQEPTLAQFAKRRAFRILPPYYFACMFAAAIALILNQEQPVFVGKWVLVHALLLHTTVAGYGNLIGQVWSIALEVSCYACFPLFVWAFRRFNARLVLLVLAGLNAAFRWQAVRMVGLGTETWDDLFPLVNSVFGRCFEFAMGMLAAACISDWLTTGKFPLRVYDLLAIVPALWKVEPSIFDPHSAARLDPAFDISWGVLFGVLVILCSQDGAARRVLAFPALVWAGEISYSVYLVHGHVLLGLIHLVKAAKYSVVTLAAVEMFIMVPLSFGIGYVFFWLFERPFLSRRSPPLLVPLLPQAIKV